MSSVRYSRLLSGFLSACLLSFTLPVSAEVAADAKSAVDAGSDPKVIRVAADPWCPYNCEPEQVQQGLRAVHVHHGLHAEADRWAEHCAEFCKALGVERAHVIMHLTREGFV